MLKKHESTFSTFQKLTDFFSVTLLWGLAYFIRFEYLPHAEKGLDILFLKLAPLIGLATIYSFYKNGLYKSQRFTNKFKEIFLIIQANSFSVVSFILIIYFLGSGRVLARLTLVIYYAISTIGLIILRLSVRNFLRKLRTQNKNLRHILLVGNGSQIKQYIKNARLFKDAGLKFIGWVDSDGLNKEFNIPDFEFNAQQISDKIDSIVLSYHSKSSEKIEAFLVANYDNLIPIQILPDLSFSLIGHHIENFNGIPLLTINQPTLNQFAIFTKRIFDFFCSLIGIILLAPVFVLIAVMTKVSSKGPIFYGQERVGFDGENFLMWKFRTMNVVNKEEDKTEWSSKDNPRKTKVGTFLRSTSLDELPQLWNVLNGDMTLVGPRPERPFFVKKFKNEIPGYMLKHKMKPGITGWAQINGWRGDTSIEKRIECDLFYIKNWNFWFDIKILLLTVIKGFINKNAY